MSERSGNCAFSRVDVLVNEENVIEIKHRNFPYGNTECRLHSSNKKLKMTPKRERERELQCIKMPVIVLWMAHKCILYSMWLPGSLTTHLEKSNKAPLSFLKQPNKQASIWLRANDCTCLKISQGSHIAVQFPSAQEAVNQTESLTHPRTTHRSDLRTAEVGLHPLDLSNDSQKSSSSE